MKILNHVPKDAFICLVIGLMITICTSIVGRFVTFPDALKGFLTGLGLAVEMIAVVKISKGRKGQTCAASKNVEQFR